MKVAIVIPARYGSSRFPGKPLHPIRGVTLLERVYRLARAVEGVETVAVATDDERIARHAGSFGAEVVMTPESCRNGTERIGAALDALSTAPDVVVNFQGDAVLTPPWIMQPLVDAMRADPAIRMATPAVRMSPDEIRRSIAAGRSGKAGGTTVVFDRRFDALYFSKQFIPNLRDPAVESPPCWRHIGMYAYTIGTLRELLELPMGPLEAVEQLEQLRALEHGIPVRVVPVDYRGRSHASIDNPDDVARTLEIIEQEGELLPEFEGRAP
jgi:3-deoxy-manno-octulosonate cytidylyltransferase (CMP-KDO synthetase)